MRFLRPAVVGLAVLSVACASSSGSASALLPDRAPDGAPPVFDPTRGDLRIAGADTLAGAGCLNPLVDPRDGERLTLVRSWSVHGDYEVAEGRYGLGEGELLRVECNTGRVLGVARR